MNAILLLVGLLVLSYLGSFLVGGRTIRGAGLPSGIEYVVLGFVLGPHVLGILGRDLLGEFEPIAQVALGWLALVIGLDFGKTGDRRVGGGAMVLGLLSGIVTGAMVGGAVWLYEIRVRHAPADFDRILLAGGIGAACAETTRHAIRWAAERHGASGPLTTLLGDFAHADDFVPLIATAVLFALAPMNAAVPVHFAWWIWVAITIGFGLVLGGMTAMHIGRELRVDQTWGVLLGMSVLGIGVAARLGISALSVLFFMGFATAQLSRHRATIRAMVIPIERPILLPALVLAGAHVDLRAMPGLPWIIGAAIAARVLAKMLIGTMLSVRRASPLLGAGLLSSGALSMSVGLAFALRFPGPTGNAILATACVTCILGEMIGPLMLRKLLRDAGEIDDSAPASTAETVAAP